MLYAAPVVAMLAGLSAEWLDFRGLRYPLLFLVGAGVLATAWALSHDGGWRAFARVVLLGIATWAAAETLYVIIHTLRGTPFEAERFGSQPMQALGLIGVHGLFLGLPTGLVAAVILHVRTRLRR